MKRLFICTGMLLFTVTMAVAQKTKGKPAAKKTVTAATSTVPLSKVAMKNLSDSFSYAAGLNIASNMREQGITNVNMELLTKAMNDVFNNKEKALTIETANSCMRAQMDVYDQLKRAEMQKRVQPEIAKGQAFLAANKMRQGVNVLPDGLQYEVIKAGDPAGIKPTVHDTVVVNYVGKLVDGTEFDSSTKNGGPITFPVNGVIKGWVEILQLMTKGAHWKVFIPYELAYGTQGAGAAIPPGAALIFDIMLEDIKAAPTADK